MTVTGPGAEGYSTFFAIVCATAVYRDKTSVRLREYSQLRGAVAVGQSVQFFNWGEDGFLRVFPWATHPFDIKSDHYAVQGCLDILMTRLQQPAQSHISLGGD